MGAQRRPSGRGRWSSRGVAAVSRVHQQALRESAGPPGPNACRDRGLERGRRPRHLIGRGQNRAAVAPHFEQDSRKPRVRQGMPLPVSRAALVEAVTAAREFSRRQGMGYVGWLDKSLSLLGSRNPSAPYHPDMLPRVGYPLDARRVLAAAPRRGSSGHGAGETTCSRTSHRGGLLEPGCEAACAGSGCTYRGRQLVRWVMPPGREHTRLEAVRGG